MLTSFGKDGMVGVGAIVALAIGAFARKGVGVAGRLTLLQDGVKKIKIKHVNETAYR